MKKYIKPIINIETISSKEVFTLSATATEGNYGGALPGDKNVGYDFSNDSWN